jgi:THO complex subunit 2
MECRPNVVFLVALKAKQNVDNDRETLAYVVKKLLVSGASYKCTFYLSPFVMQVLGIVNANVCRERLEMALVANVGLIADKAAFEKKEIRTRTGLL